MTLSTGLKICKSPSSKPLMSPLWPHLLDWNTRLFHQVAPNLFSKLISYYHSPLTECSQAPNGLNLWLFPSFWFSLSSLYPLTPAPGGPKPIWSCTDFGCFFPGHNGPGNTWGRCSSPLQPLLSYRESKFQIKFFHNRHLLVNRHKTMKSCV